MRAKPDQFRIDERSPMHQQDFAGRQDVVTIPVEPDEDVDVEHDDDAVRVHRDGETEIVPVDEHDHVVIHEEDSIVEIIRSIH